MAVLRAVCEEPEEFDRTLRLLTHLEFLEERFESGESTFVFKQALVHEVILGGLLERQRRALQERVALAERALRSADPVERGTPVAASAD